ncbi:MAG: adenine deaminase C-terminal domain-containing protein, partial [Rikenellaceae bacterium]
ITVAEEYKPMCSVENLESDIDNDIVKIVYINRYTNGEPQVAFCRGFGLKMGAFASSVAHDSHNIIAVGCADEDIVNSVNKIIDHKGGLSVSLQGSTDVLPLPIGGIMCSSSAEKTADDYERLNERVQQMGCRLSAPFMTLSFLSLVVIPELKIGEMGLFSYSEFNWIG